MYYSYTEDHEIQAAFEFLVLSFQQRRVRNRNKPVILHSIRVGMYLYNRHYPKDIVIAGILHDLLEDTDVSYKDLAEKYGEKVARLVQAGSFDAGIKDKKAQYEKIFSNCLKEGKDAILIKTADLIDNLPYMLDPKSSGDLYEFLKGKIGEFLEQMRPVMQREVLFEELEKLYKTYTEPNGPTG
jgi:(p)ppGpp synthase/HD superfamily hydrolase